MKTASKGIITGILLASARISRRNRPAPLHRFRQPLLEPRSRGTDRRPPLQIFSYAISPYDDWHRQAWAGALVLVVGIFLINVIVRFLTRGRTAHFA